MTLRSVIEYELTCDGHRPDGRPCTVQTHFKRPLGESPSEFAESIGWTHGEQGWICNARGGHRP